MKVDRRPLGLPAHQERLLTSTDAISVRTLIRRFWKKTALTWVLVTLEGVALVLMPLVIGRAVDAMMNDSLRGLVELGGLCAAALAVGAGRRFYDTRAYAAIYRETAGELVRRETGREAGLSKVSARVNLLTEFVEFLEDSIPEMIHQSIHLLGTMVIIAWIDWRIFAACMIAVAVTTVVYGVSRKRIFRLHRGANDQIEKQVDVLESRSPARTASHFARLMRWRIRLSDLETVNYSLIWTVLAGVLVFTAATVGASGVARPGLALSTVMYVFGFIESILAFPIYYEQLVRLQEIGARLRETPSSETGIGATEVTSSTP